MNMSMDKPIALKITEGTRGRQVKNAKTRSPGLVDYDISMSMDKPIA